MFTRLCIAGGGVAIASLANHSVHRVHAATTAPDSAGTKTDIKPDSKTDNKTDKKSDNKSDTSSKAKSSKAGDIKTGTKKTKISVKASELPIYGDPEPVTFEVIEHKPSAYYTAVSDARKYVWTYSESVQKSTSKICDAYEVTKKTTKDGLQYIQKDSGVVPKAVFISVAGLGGIVAGFRGGFFRKTMYASIAMAGAASVCYPDEAVAISKKGWRTVRDFTSQTYKDNVSSTKGSSSSKTPPPPPSSTQPMNAKSPAAQFTDKIENIPPVSVELKSDDPRPPITPFPSTQTVTIPSPPSKGGDGVKKDFGMSKAEDKDMYSTRGK